MKIIFFNTLALLFVVVFFGLNSHAEGVVKAEEEFFEFNFSDKVDIRKLVKKMSKILGINIIFSQKIKGSIQVFAPQKLTKVEAKEIFVSILEMLNYTTIETGSIIKITSQKEDKVGARSYPVDSKIPYDLEIVSKMYTLKDMTVNSAKRLISKLVTSTRVIMFERINVLMVVGYTHNISRLDTIFSLLDVKGSSKQINILSVKNAVAEDILNTVKKLGIFKKSDEFKMLVDKPTNSIITYGTDHFYLRLRTIVEKLDNEIRKKVRKIFVVKKLDFIKAKDIVSVINKVKNKAEDTAEDVDKVMKDFDELSLGTVSKDVLVQADEESNSMLIFGEDKSIKTIVSIVKRLDVKRPQVFFEINVLEINESYGLKFETSQLGLGAEAGKDLKIITGWQGGRVTPLVRSQLSEGSSLSNVEEVVKGTSEDLTIGVMSSKGVSVMGMGSFTPSALITMIKNDSQNKILLSPYILTTDGEESMLNFGQMVSFLMQETNPSGIVQSVLKKENTGVTLTMTPKVSQGGDIVLKLSVELGAVIGLSKGEVDFAKRKIKQEVVLKGGQTVFLSGFTSSNSFRRARKVPILGDIPILGFLLNNLSHEYSKNSLLIFITPNIIYGSGDLLALYKEKKRQRKIFLKEKLDFR